MLTITRWESLTNNRGDRRVVRVADFFARLSKMAVEPRPAIKKDELPGWSPATFANDTRGKKHLKTVTALVLDYDSGDPLDAVANSWPYRGLLHTSPSHTEQFPRCRVIVLLSRAVTPDEHRILARWALTRASAAGHTLDEKATKNGAGLWFVPACQPGAIGAAISLHGSPLDVGQVLHNARSVEPVPPIEAPPQKTPPDDHGVDRAVAAIMASYGRSGDRPGNRNTTLNDEAFKLKQRADQGGLNWPAARDIITRAAIDNGMGAAEVENTIKSAEAGAARSPRPGVPTPRARRDFHPALDPDDPGASEPPPELDGNAAPALSDPAETDPRWFSGLLLNKAGNVRPTPGNALTILENDPALQVVAYDNFRDQIVFTKRPPWAEKNAGTFPRSVTDTDTTRAGRFLENFYGIAVEKNKLADAIEAAARRNEFDPLATYIDGLDPWDQTPRIDTWLTKFFGAKDSAYTKAIGRAWLISGIARALCKSADGVQVDHVLVLEGPQGARKSSGLRALAGEFFSDEVPDLTTKDAAISLQGVWLIELSELESLRRADITKIKAWIVRRVDRYRPPYGRTTVCRPRRCIFAATTNDQHNLKDYSGNRRFWPVTCGAVDVGGLQADRDQLWAEALHAYRRSEKWWLDDEEQLLAAQAAQAERMDLDPWEEPISRYVDGRFFVTTRDLLDDLNMERGRADKLHARRIAEILRKLGLTVRRRVTLADGGREYRFSRPPCGACGAEIPGDQHKCEK